jgi:multiple sugar transport system permease protein
MVSSAFQPENEITSKPPHWIAHHPTIENFRVIFTSENQEITYENRKQGDTATGGFIPSTAKYLLPSMWNSFIVGITVVLLNLIISIPAAYAMAKIRFIGRSTSVYFMLATRVIPDIALVVPFFSFIQKLGLMDSKLSLIITYLAITIPFSVFILVSYFESLLMS